MMIMTAYDDETNMNRIDKCTIRIGRVGILCYALQCQRI